jgi:branched-chain amino acid aminotransferase
MPCMIRLWTKEGLQSIDYRADSLNDAVRFEPDDGVYTVTNTYNIFQTLKLDAHLNRLEDSARRAGIELVLDRPKLRLVLRQMIDESGYGNVRFRVTVSRNSPDLLISVEPFIPISSEIIETGVRCITVPHGARDNPMVKATEWMHNRSSIRDSLPPGIYAAILLDDADRLLEGLSSNFYAIQNGELRTAGAGVLAGIAQQIVFEIASGIVPVRKDAVRLRDVPHLDEAFVTSSSRGIVPVVEIDGHVIGEGKPGKITTSLRVVYAVWVNNHLEEL